MDVLRRGELIPESGAENGEGRDCEFEGRELLTGGEGRLTTRDRTENGYK